MQGFTRVVDVVEVLVVEVEVLVVDVLVLLVVDELLVVVWAPAPDATADDIHATSAMSATTVRRIIIRLLSARWRQSST